MAIRIDNEDIWYWYEWIEKFHAQPLPQRKFCRANNLDYNTFIGRHYRIVYKSRSYPDLYVKLVTITRKYFASNMNPVEFVKHNDISLLCLSQTATHLNYIDIIEAMKAKKGITPMNFIQVPTVQSMIPIAEEPEAPEIIEKQNDLEIIISKGVKVSISPNIDSMKIIKVIELLKDL